MPTDDEGVRREIELRWEGHTELHKLLAEAITKAESAAGAALKAALDDHHREHLAHAEAHGREHAAAAEAIRVADVAMTQRLTGLNAFRELVEVQSRTFATTDRVDGMQRENERRIDDFLKLSADRAEALRQRIEIIEKGDASSSAKSLGQTGIIAAIVTAIIVAGVIVGLVSNLGRIVQ